MLGQVEAERLEPLLVRAERGVDGDQLGMERDRLAADGGGRNGQQGGADGECRDRTDKGQSDESGSEGTGHG
jgi:hypothetical protein